MHTFSVNMTDKHSSLLNFTNLLLFTCHSSESQYSQCFLSVYGTRASGNANLIPERHDMVVL